MKLHANAALTIKQRREVKQLFEMGKLPIVEIARRFCVSPQTVRRWIGRSDFQDRQVTSRTPRVVTPEYESAVIEYRKQNPRHGAIRIALALQAGFPFAGRGTVALILKRQGLTKKAKPRQRTNWKIPVGRHRLQCDIQELPAIKGNKGFEYKISFIHLRTRWKYSEIHADCRTETVASVYQRALDNLPPFS
jgi:transposase